MKPFSTMLQVLKWSRPDMGDFSFLYTWTPLSPVRKTIQWLASPGHYKVVDSEELCAV